VWDVLGEYCMMRSAGAGHPAVVSPSDFGNTSESFGFSAGNIWDAIGWEFCGGNLACY
jgi:hypothetical protein